VTKSSNLKNRMTIRMDGGDCNPAQIGYYPVYDFDGCTTPLFRKGGLSKKKNGYKIVGIPLVDVRA